MILFMRDNFNQTKLVVYTDGGARGNPGPAAVGVVICNEDDEVIKEYSEYLGRATNNEAEYQAVVLAMRKVKHLFGGAKAKQSDLNFRLDSELVVKQLNHQYKIEEARLQGFFLKIWNLTLDFKSVSFSSIRREENKRADKLVNQVLDQQSLSLF